MLFENRTEVYLFLLVSKSVLCKSFAYPGRLVHFPAATLLIPIYNVHRGDRQEAFEVCLHAGMWVISELLSPTFALKNHCCFETSEPMCIWLGCKLHRKKLQTSISQ